jgi:hypothetical protein
VDDDQHRERASRIVSIREGERVAVASEIRQPQVAVVQSGFGPVQLSIDHHEPTATVMHEEAVVCRGERFEVHRHIRKQLGFTRFAQLSIEREPPAP